MITGLILRHYKIYKALNYIPVCDRRENNLSIYVGNNGVGKSSILEALNTFFNNGIWNKHKEGKQDETFICPVCLIKKTELNSFRGVSTEDKETIECLSNHFWTLTPSGGTGEINKFFAERDELLKTYSSDDYYLIIVGNTFKNKNLTYFGSGFDVNARNALTTAFPEYNLDNLLQIVRSFYSFVYIPVESKVADTLKLETFEMQQMMNKDILEIIDVVLNAREFTVPGSTAKTNAVNYLNKSLNNFMNEINNQIKAIDDKYSFKVDVGYKKNLTAFDLREKILEAYFSIRTLKKETKEIYELSSGEQRIALIDIATAFLNNSGEKDGFLILAIDEPEASLHISKCFNQFKRLENLTKQSDLQVMLTTHWYGSLPTIQKGNLHHIDFGDKPSITTFDFLNFMEERRNFPDDIEMKSFFELVTTLISSIKNENINWLICEGSDDKNYITHYLGDEVNNLHIMPVGGCGNVIKLYEYLFAPFSEKKEKALLTEGKVLCLIDSDIEQKTIKVNSNVGNQLKNSRLQLNSDSTFELRNLTNTGRYEPTTVEDCLNSSIMYSALTETVNELSESSIKELFDKFEFNDDNNNSRIEGESSIIKPKEVEVIARKPELYLEFKKNNFKYKLAENYISKAKDVTHDRPDLFSEIIKFYNE
jgi:predicted ATPase